MLKNILRISLGFAGLVLMVGCASSGVEMHTYAEDKARVDQKIDGNAGYLKGTTNEATESNKKTRRIYVMEFSKAAKVEQPNGAPETAVVTQTKKASASRSSEFSSEESAGETMPFETTTTTNSSVSEHKKLSSATEYKVEKDDTLQKISKKFYGSYSKWTKIYDANKEKIKDPNHIKHGITITIPAE